MKRTFIIVFIVFFTSSVLPQTVVGQDPPGEYVQANQLYSQGRYPDAIRSYRSVLSSPSHSISPGVLYTRIADSYFKLMDYERARDAYRKALYNQKRGERAQTQYWIGFCAMLLGRDAEAVTELLKIPKNYPDSGIWVGTAYYWAGRASERVGKKKQAVEFYRKAGGKGLSTQERFAIEKAKSVKQAPKNKHQ